MPPDAITVNRTLDRPAVVRIQGLPGADVEAARLDVCRTIDSQQADSAVCRPYKVVVVPSCTHDGELVALVDFPQGLPDFLSKIRDNPLDTWEIELATAEEDVSFDRHFLGFTQLYDPNPSQDVAADIVAICGIDGHAYGSWQGRGSMRRMWLRHFLSRDLPSCRTMIYGYDAKLARRGFAGLEDYARGFLEDIKRVRRGKAEKRPLIFIAHSFGGIILARALIKATQRNEADHPAVAALHASTYGILFFAVPHRGLDVEDMSRIMDEESHPRRELLQQINVDSTQLAAQLQEFQDLLYDRKIVSFYEMEQSKRLKRNTTGQWSRSGEYFTSLEADRAILHLPKQVETRIPMQCDHSSIVKFDNRHDSGYVNAIANLRDFVAAAPAVVYGRYAASSEPASFAQASTTGTKVLLPPHIATNSKDTFNLPFDLGGIAETSNFVGRRAELTKIETAFSKKQQGRQVVVLHGFGGIGKTQVAANYAKEHQSSYACVLWLNCANERSLHQSFTAAARRILTRLPATEGLQEAMQSFSPPLIVDAVHEWLQNPQNSRWLMIFDNVDEPDIPGVLKGDFDVRSYFPTSTHGHILLTTRVIQLTRVGVAVPIKKMHDFEECVEILQSIAGRDFSSEGTNLRKLMERLDGLPLAISTAGAYLSQVPDNLKEYLDDYEKSWLELQQNSPELIDYEDRTLHTTWDISLRHIQRQSPVAVNMMKLWACLDNQDLWYELVQPIAHRGGGWARALVKSRITFNKEMRILCDVGLVEPQKIKYEKPDSKDVPEGTEKSDTNVQDEKEVIGYSLHRCVHDWICGKISQPLDHAMLALALWCVGKNVPAQPDREYWLTQQRLLGHADWWYKRSVEAGLSSFQKVDWEQLKMVGTFFCVARRHHQALEILTHSFWTFRATEGMQGFNTLTVSNCLGTIYLEQGRLSEAYAMFHYVAYVFEAQLGPKHGATLDVFNNLGVLFVKRGLPIVAQRYFTKVLQGRQKLYGSDSMPAMTAYRNQALLLAEQGKLDAAEALASQAMTFFEEKYGPTHQQTIHSYLALASILESKGDLDQVVVLLEKALKNQEKVYGREGQSALRTMTQLGVAYRKLGKLPAAEKTLAEALRRLEASVGPEHPATLHAVNNLGVVLRLLDKLARAESMSLRAWEARNRLLGAADRDTLHSLYNLAVVEALNDKVESAARRFEFFLANAGSLPPDAAKMVDSAREMLQVILDEGGK